MTVSGDAAQLDDLRNKIRAQDKNCLDELFTWFLGGNYFGLLNDPADIAETGDLFLDFTCKWEPPTDEIASLSALYSGLIFEVRHEESGNASYGTLTYSEGAVVASETYDEESYLEKYDEEYAEFAQVLDDQPYAEFLDEVLENLECIQEGDTCRYAHLAERKYLAKMKDQDLPLLINYKWQYSYTKSEYEKRLKGAK
jgi:hypothetical protein